MLEDFFNNPVATKQAIDLAKEMCAVMKEKRESFIISATGKPVSIRSLCAKKNMDYTILSRAENPTLNTVPALSFWLDWTESLNVELGDIVKQARAKLKQK